MSSTGIVDSNVSSQFVTHSVCDEDSAPILDKSSDSLHIEPATVVSESENKNLSLEVMSTPPNKPKLDEAPMEPARIKRESASSCREIQVENESEAETPPSGTVRLDPDVSKELPSNGHSGNPKDPGKEPPDEEPDDYEYYYTFTWTTVEAANSGFIVRVPCVFAIGTATQFYSLWLSKIVAVMETTSQSRHWTSCAVLESLMTKGG